MVGDDARRGQDGADGRLAAIEEELRLRDERILETRRQYHAARLIGRRDHVRALLDERAILVHDREALHEEQLRLPARSEDGTS